MPNVHLVTGSVGKAAVIGILTVQDEVDECLLFDPVDTVDDGKAAQHPPTVANVFLLLGPAVEPASWKLSLTQPAAELLVLYKIKTSSDGESSDAGKDLSGMRLCSWLGPVAAVKVRARDDVSDGFINVYKRQKAQ